VRRRHRAGRDEFDTPRRRSSLNVAMHDDDFEVRPVGTVRSPLTDLAAAPKQAHEGAPEAWLVFEPAVVDALDALRVGDEVIVLTWLHRADRDVLRVHPRGDVANPIQGVFSTRSPARPNPIGLHEVQVLAIEGARVRVSALEAVDGTPVLDVKPVLRPADA
jgi:tRNA-Thr(GGU) m(6)t(6)A37 methyltransferase TsaA